jgi:hypothetical protein
VELKEEYYFYLDLLRESGEINMIEAPRYLQDEFGLTKAESFVMFSAWATHKQEQANGDIHS